MDATKKIETDLRAFALSLPGAVEDYPWGERVAKVNKRVFVFFGVPSPGELRCVVKLPTSAVSVLDRGLAESAGYGLGKSGWIAAKFTEGQRIPVDEVKRWIEESYRAIAPKKLVAVLDGAPGTKSTAPIASSAKSSSSAAKSKTGAEKRARSSKRSTRRS